VSDLLINSDVALRRTFGMGAADALVAATALEQRL